jgi:hypothetical protein
MKTNLSNILIGTAACAVVALSAFLVFQSHIDPTQTVLLPSKSHEPATVASPSATSLTSPASLPSVSRLDSILAEADPTRRQELLAKWAQSIDVKVMAGLLTQMDALPDAKLKGEVRAALLTSWGQRDLDGAFTWFGERNGADRLQQQVRDILVQSTANRDPVKMFEWMQASLPESAQKELYGPFFRQWALNNPQEAAATLRQLANPLPGHQGADPVWNDLLSQVAAQWAQSNLGDALAWVKAQPEGACKSRALISISQRWAVVHPEDAAAYAVQQNNSALLRIVASEWAATNPQAAADWAAHLPGGTGREAAIGSLATVWAEQDPKAAVSFVLNLPSGTSQIQAAKSAVASWAETAPQQAAQWAGQLPEGSLREQTLSALLGSWATTNASEASQWMQTLPSSPSRDAAITAYAQAVYASAPNRAFAWSSRISDEDLRTQQEIAVARFWLKQNPTEAETQINLSNLPQALKTDLLADARPNTR